MKNIIIIINKKIKTIFTTIKRMKIIIMIIREILIIKKRARITINKGIIILMKIIKIIIIKQTLIILNLSMYKEVIHQKEEGEIFMLKLIDHLIIIIRKIIIINNLNITTIINIILIIKKTKIINIITDKIIRIIITKIKDFLNNNNNNTTKIIIKITSLKTKQIIIVKKNNNNNIDKQINNFLIRINKTINIIIIIDNIINNLLEIFRKDKNKSKRYNRCIPKIMVDTVNIADNKKKTLKTKEINISNNSSDRRTIKSK